MILLQNKPAEELVQITVLNSISKSFQQCSADLFLEFLL